jgi:hypothetical protein
MFKSIRFAHHHPTPKGFLPPGDRAEIAGRGFPDRAQCFPEICGEIREGIGRPLGPSALTIRQCWQVYGIDSHRPKLGHPRPIDLLVEATVLRQPRGLLKRGVKKRHGTLLLPRYDHPGPISATDIKKFYQLPHFGVAKGSGKRSSPSGTDMRGATVISYGILIYCLFMRKIW